MRFLSRVWGKNMPPSPRQSVLKTGHKSQLTESLALDIRAGGSRLRAEFYGPRPKNAVTVIFLHEGLGSIAQWHDFPGRIAEAANCSVIVYDRLGHGDSDPLVNDRPPDYHMTEARSVLPDVMDAFDVEQVILFGHSDGATIGLLFAATHPELTLGVIAEAPHVFVEDVSIEGIRAAREDFNTGTLRSRLKTYHGENTDTMFNAWADTWLNPTYRDWSVEDQLPDINAPVMLIQGENDQYGTAEQLTRIADGVSGQSSTLLVPECGHTPHFEKHEEVFEATLRFIRKYTPE